MLFQKTLEVDILELFLGIQWYYILRIILGVYQGIFFKIIRLFLDYKNNLIFKTIHMYSFDFKNSERPKQGNKNPDFEFFEILSILSLWLTWLYNELHFLYNPTGMCLWPYILLHLEIRFQSVGWMCFFLHINSKLNVPSVPCACLTPHHHMVQPALYRQILVGRNHICLHFMAS